MKRIKQMAVNIDFAVPVPYFKRCVVFTLVASAVETPKIGLQTPTQSLPEALRRMIFLRRPKLVVAVIPDLSNRIRLVFMNIDKPNARKVVEESVSDVERELRFDLEASFEDDGQEVECDMPVWRIAWESLGRLCFENSGWYFCRFPELGHCLVSRDPPCVMVANVTVQAIMSYAIPVVSAFRSASHVKVPSAEATLAVTGNITSLNVKYFLDSLHRTQMDSLMTNKSLRFDSLPCSVLPNCRIAYAVEVTTKVPSELHTYWKYVHGIELSDITHVFHITFVRGCEDHILTYPSQCVLQPHCFAENPPHRVNCDLSRHQNLIRDILSSAVTSTTFASHL